MCKIEGHFDHFAREFDRFIVCISVALRRANPLALRCPCLTHVIGGRTKMARGRRRRTEERTLVCSEE